MLQEMYKISDSSNIKKLENILFYDNLTGALTQYGFYQYVQDVINSIFSSGKKPAYIYVDIVGMKRINNEYGYYAGNEVVASVARLLAQVFAEGICSRYEDDHFIILVQNTDVDIRVKKITSIFSVNKYPVPEIQMRFGVYVQEEIDEDPSICCDKARLAEQSVHQKQGEFIGRFSDDMYEIYRRKQYIIAHLENSIRDREIEVYYHPIVRSLTEKTCALEALARWNSKDMGVISPGEFIPILEKEHLSAVLDLYMAERVLKEIFMRREIGLPLIPVSVNLSQSDLETQDMVTAISDLVEKYKVDPKYLIIEISEKACVANPSKVSAVIDGFHAHGIKVWMDDFGNGVSSLNLLKYFDFDLIKFDKGFLSGFDEGGRAEEIFRYTIMMIHKLHLQTVAEGVETREQYLQLRLLGCERMQGYLFAKPKPLNMYGEKASKKAWLLTEDMESNLYYDKVGFANIADVKLPEGVGVRVEELPEGLLEVRSGKIVCLRANYRLFERLQESLKHIPMSRFNPGWFSNTVTGEDNDNARKLDEEALKQEKIMSWAFEPDEDLLKAMEEAGEEWREFSHTTLKGDVIRGWTRLVAMDESREAKCFEVILC